MDKIKEAFLGKKANIAYIVAGYPSATHTANFINNLDKSCINLLEIGIPYSDPLADGKVIFDASFQACQNGITTDSVFEILSDCKTTRALVFLVYYNLIFAYGEDKFIQKAKEARISGFIIPDLPFEENKDMFEKCQKAGIALIPLISVTSDHRAKKVLSRSSGFIYGLGAIGVTGSRQTPQDRLKNMVKDLKKMSDLPVAIGFGIKTKDDVKSTYEYADGAIIGTNIVKLCKDYEGVELMKKVDELFGY